MKRNKPILLKHDEKVGYRGKQQAVYDIIAEIEKWGQEKHFFASGYTCNGVERAKRENIIQVYEV